MGTIAITGSASGIGAATRARLEADGHTVIGIDLRDAEVVADLSTAAGRTALVAEVGERSGGVLDGAVAVAGIRNDDGAPVVSVNYFGAVATLDGLRPLLARSSASSAVAICSNSATTQPGLSDAVVQACLAGDEDRARELAGPDGMGAYGEAKLALARWLRRQAPTEPWIGHAVRLNGVAPGFVDTPLTEGQWDFISSLGPMWPMPAGRPGRPEEIAAAVAFLLSPESSYFVGSILVPDGGTEAALRADDWPAAL